MWHPHFKDLYPWRQRPHPAESDHFNSEGGVWFPWRHNPCEVEAFAVKSRELRSTSNPWYCGVLLLPGEFASWKEARQNIILLPCHWVFIWGLVRRVVWHFVLGSKETFLCWWWLENWEFSTLLDADVFLLAIYLMHLTAGLRQCPRCYCSHGDSCHDLRSCE